MRAALTSNRKLLGWVIFASCMLLAAFAVAAYAISHAAASQRHTNRQICIAFNQFDRVVTQTLRRSQANLPKLAYFREHPDELADQQATIRRQLRLFRPKRC